MKRFKILAILLVLCLMSVAIFSACDSSKDKGTDRTKQPQSSASDVGNDSGLGGADSSNDGTTDSSIGGTTDSSNDGTTDSSNDGTTDSSNDGTTDSSNDGTTDSSNGGATDSSNGTTDSSNDGTTDSSIGGTTDSSNDGTTDSSNDGTTDSSNDGTTDSSIGGTPNDNVPHVHSFDQIKVEKRATCIETGERTKKCACGLSVSEEIPKTDHSYLGWETIREASCQEDGEEQQICSVCDHTEVEYLPALGHKLDSQGKCSRCDYISIKNAVIFSIDVSSSMKEIMGTNVSRFNALIATLEKALAAIDENTLLGIIAFDSSVHLVSEPQFMPLDKRDVMIEKITRQLLHIYYYYYLDEAGNETEIPVKYTDNVNDFTALGLVRPNISNTNNFDKQTGIFIKSYGTSYTFPVLYARDAFEEIAAENKSFIFISDGEPNDINSEYIEIIAHMAENGIVTSTVAISDRSSSLTELNRICQSGGGKATVAATPEELDICVLSLLGIEGYIYDETVTDENGFVFTVVLGKPYLSGYTGSDSDLVLPEYFNGAAYSFASNALDGLEFVNSITFPSTITRIPNYAVTNCTHLYTVKFLSESTTYVEQYSFDGCVRISEVYGRSYLYSPSLLKSHSSLDEESIITIQENGLVYAVTSAFHIYLVDYLGNAEALRIELPQELLENPELAIGCINYYAFYEKNIKSVTFDEGFKQVFDYAFAKCENLECVAFEGVIRFNQYDNLFLDCSSLEFLEAAKFETPLFNLSSSPNAVVICTGDVAPILNDGIIVVKNSTDYGFTDDGFKWVISTDFNGVAIVGYSGSSTEVNIPTRINIYVVTTIFDYAFANHSELVALTIPSSVVCVGKNAFVGCDGIIQNIGGLLYVGNWLVGCKDTVTEATVLPSVVGIACNAFDGISSLTSIHIPATVAYLNKNAVINCLNVTVLTRHPYAPTTWSEGWNPDNVPTYFNVCQVHQWIEADCYAPKHCANCSVSVGGPVHVPDREPTCTEASYCTICLALVHEALGHDFQGGSTCVNCLSSAFESVLVRREEIESLTASHTGGGAPNLEYLFDGDKTSVGIFGTSVKEYYAEAPGNYFTIVLKEEMTVCGITFWGSGNFTQMKVSLYDEYGGLVMSEVLDYNSNAYGDELGEFPMTFSESVRVKTIVATVTSVKWYDCKTHKTSEVEIFTLKAIEN